jgi:hypothetical protein
MEAARAMQTLPDAVCGQQKHVTAYFSAMREVTLVEARDCSGRPEGDLLLEETGAEIEGQNA